ncbi:hypothetical protein V202x_50270 [Gimesia aquarii]|uniref:Uncharacterized protein n=1 Tax=Gimesia aquarii TaxID=2527964 RepID=A0A517X272_9PLAN|nr:hypothetical protein V202x_50270 [Gimesia aquarii]
MRKIVFDFSKSIKLSSRSGGMFLTILIRTRILAGECNDCKDFYEQGRLMGNLTVSIPG